MLNTGHEDSHFIYSLFQGTVLPVIPTTARAKVEHYLKLHPQCHDLARSRVPCHQVQPEAGQPLTVSRVSA